ncbi:MAG: hypothetical protein K0S24_828 [Sphingobacterium sp.]|jgi:hypothetical protein|nr:hypothetical protein [Sphingobacterium sp.]
MIRSQSTLKALICLTHQDLFSLPYGTTSTPSFKIAAFNLLPSNLHLHNLIDDI